MTDHQQTRRHRRSRASIGSSNCTEGVRPQSSFRRPTEPLRDSPLSSVGGNRSLKRCGSDRAAAISEKSRQKRGANEHGVVWHQRSRWSHQRERRDTAIRRGIRSFSASVRGLTASADRRCTPPTTCVFLGGGLTRRTFGRHRARTDDCPFTKTCKPCSGARRGSGSSMR